MKKKTIVKRIKDWAGANLVRDVTVMLTGGPGAARTECRIDVAPVAISRERAIAALAIKNRLLRVLAARCDGFAIDEALGPDGCFLLDRGQAGACRRPPGGHCRIAEQNAIEHFKTKRARRGATLRKGGRA